MLLESLAEALAEAQRVDPSALQGEALASHTLQLQKLRASFDAIELAALDAVAGAAPDTVYPSSTFRRPQQWLTFEARQSARQTGRRFRVADVVHREYPAIGRELAAGRIGMSHVDVFMRLADRCELSQALQRDLHDLLGWATGRQWIDFKVLTEAWAEMTDPTDPQKLDDKAYTDRGLAWADAPGGTSLIEMQMPTVLWAQLREGFEPLVSQMFDEDWADATARFGDDVAPSDLCRTDTQRRLDAVAQLMRAGIGRVDPGCTAVVNVVVDERTLTDEADRQQGRPTEPRPMRDAETRRCETTNGHRLTPSLALQFAVAGQIRRVVLDAPALEMSSKQRVFTGNLRQAVLLKHRVCDAPGCEVPSYRCEVDHVIPAARGGPTTAENGRPRCRADHAHKTRLENLGLL